MDCEGAERRERGERSGVSQVLHVRTAGADRPFRSACPHTHTHTDATIHPDNLQGASPLVTDPDPLPPSPSRAASTPPRSLEGDEGAGRQLATRHRLLRADALPQVLELGKPVRHRVHLRVRVRVPVCAWVDCMQSACVHAGTRTRTHAHTRTCAHAHARTPAGAHTQGPFPSPCMSPPHPAPTRPSVSP